MNIIVAITGASGTIYARQLIERLTASSEVERIALIVSERGAQVLNYELRITNYQWPKVEVFDNADMFASVASGSARWNAMVVVPASMGSVGRIAGGVSSDLVSRAADVMLKEGRRLIVVPRETPLNLIHLRNLTTLVEAGAVVLPAAPSFYSHPATIEELVATVTERIISRLGLSHEGFEWGKS